MSLFRSRTRHRTPSFWGLVFIIWAILPQSVLALQWPCCVIGSIRGGGVCRDNFTEGAGECTRRNAFWSPDCSHPACVQAERVETETMRTRELEAIIQQGGANQLCFTREECEREPYRGGAQESEECKDQSSALVRQGFIYNCYAPSKTYTLQIPLLGQRTITGLERYLESVFIFLVSVSGVIAGIMIVYAGFKWLTAAGSPEKISDARRKIADASVGLILILSSYILLQTVNPALLSLQVPPIKMMRRTEMSVWCPNTASFQGRFSCGREITLGRGGSCIGQHCSSGGCYRYNDLNTSGSFVESYSCLSANACPTSCEAINNMVASDKWGYCVMDICKNRIPNLCRINILEVSSRGGRHRCVDRTLAGRWGCFVNSDCVPGLVCDQSTQKCQARR